MKIAITGHTSGLGKELYSRYDSALGISRNEDSIAATENIIERIKDVDIFINNAYDGFNQTILLNELFNIWKDKEKTIVNIVSRSKYPNISKGYLYSASKASLSHLSNNLRFVSDKKCRIIDINPGLLESDLPSLSYKEVADTIQYCINLPIHIEIGEISLWHKTPYSVISKLKDERKT
jgi:NADP-dependent 3-hydroxy acid dehydrogenase YdfG